MSEAHCLTDEYKINCTHIIIIRLRVDILIVLGHLSGLIITTPRSGGHHSLQSRRHLQAIWCFRNSRHYLESYFSDAHRVGGRDCNERAEREQHGHRAHDTRWAMASTCTVVGVRREKLVCLD
jgi:hypothetical protein